jgi:hypothetical protein
VRSWPPNGGTIYPGRYVGPCTVAGNDSIVLAGEGARDPNAGNAPIAPGQAIYYFDGGPLTSTGGSSFVSNGGALIYLAPSDPGNGLSLMGSGALNIAPLTAGPYTGLSFFQARGSAAPATLSGNGAISTWNGTFYAPSAPVTITGNGALNLAQVVSSTLTLSGNPTAFADVNASRARARFLQLVE